MDEDIFIKLLYGPYESNGIIRHKTQRLTGLIDYLTEQQITVEIQPSAHINRLAIEFMDREIFTCDFRHLPFNVLCKKDPLCLKILRIVSQHRERFTSARNVPHFPSIKEGMRLMLNEELISAKFTHPRLFDYDIFTPQNTLISRLSTPEPEDICRKSRYLGYDLGSVDLAMSQRDTTDEKEVPLLCLGSSSSSEFVDDYLICDEGSCYPTCPPGSLASDYSGEEVMHEASYVEEMFMCKECKQCYCICERIKKPN